MIATLMTRNFCDCDDKREFAKINCVERLIIRRDQNKSSGQAIFNLLNVVVSIRS